MKKNKEKLVNSRRKFIKSTSILLMACGLNVENISASSRKKSGFKVLEENDRFDIGNTGNQIIQKAYDLGFLYEEKHMGCARCTVASLQDAIDFVPADIGLFRSASCLDGGATQTKLANCGAFTGAGMFIGWICGTERFGDNKLSHKLIHEVHKYFQKEYGSVICKKIRDSAESNCPEVVGKAAQRTTEIILKQFTNYE